LDPTIYDIARKASVSIATVSRVLNNHPRVAVDTRRRVLMAAEEMNYRPHASARSLAQQKSHVITAVIPVVTNYFYMEILRGMQDALEDSEFDLVIFAASAPEFIGGQLERALQRGRSDGLVLLSARPTDEQSKMLYSARQPVVLVDAIHSAFDSVAVDNTKGGHIATQHLARLGRRRIAHLTITPENPPAAHRRQGYEQALREAGYPVDRDLIVASGKRPYGFVEEAGYEAMKQLLHKVPLPDAVFAASDMQALGALQAIREEGLSVPDDIAVVGFDNIKIAAYVGLSTLSQPMYEMGRLAAQKLINRLGSEDMPTSHTIFAPRLIPRQSCGAPAAEAAPLEIKSYIH
jgi:LacI family transcriptional regulator